MITGLENQELQWKSAIKSLLKLWNFLVNELYQLEGDYNTHGYFEYENGIKTILFWQ